MNSRVQVTNAAFLLYGFSSSLIRDFVSVMELGSVCLPFSIIHFCKIILKKLFEMNSEEINKKEEMLPQGFIKGCTSCGWNNSIKKVKQAELVIRTNRL